MIRGFRRIKNVDQSFIKPSFEIIPEGRIYKLDDSIYLIQDNKVFNSNTINLKRASLAKTTLSLSKKLFSFGCLAQLQRYGTSGSSLVDMKGIRNLVFAKALHFSDETIRQLLVACDALSPDHTYLYVGLGGASPEGAYAAGEYLQLSILNGRRGGGFGLGLRGHVLHGSEYGTTSLLGEGMRVLPDERLAYSQMALLKQQPGYHDFPSSFEIVSHEASASLLDALTEALDRLKVQACSLTILVSGTQSKPISVLGRVTKGNNPVPWNKIEDATESAIDQRFLLGPNQTLVGFGNKIRRQEPDWHRLTGGREYQARGHIHATLVGDSPAWPQHTTFHLKDIFLPTGAVAYVGIVPVERALRIFPLSTEGGRLTCEATGRPIEQLHD